MLIEAIVTVFRLTMLSHRKHIHPVQPSTSWLAYIIGTSQRFTSGLPLFIANSTVPPVSHLSGWLSSLSRYTTFCIAFTYTTSMDYVNHHLVSRSRPSIPLLASAYLLIHFIEHSQRSIQANPKAIAFCTAWTSLAPPDCGPGSPCELSKYYNPHADSPLPFRNH